MASTSTIEWTEQTWNPTTGCTKISPGCKNCYAEVMSRRLTAMGAAGYENGFELSIHESRLSQPLNRKKATTYFVNSMSDLFHEKMPYSYLDEVFETITQTPHHTYQILTKREEILGDYFTNKIVPNNVWLGVTVENAKSKNRIDVLRNIDAKIRFLSIEPLLQNVGELNLDNIHWVIVGGESGHKARQMKEEWAIDIQKQCDEQEVSFFFKQWGTWGADGQKRSKKANGRILLGKEWNEEPEYILVA